MKNNNYLKIKDFNTIILLYAFDCVLENTEKKDSSVFFYFSDKERCEKIIDDYYGGLLTIDPRIMLESTSKIRQIIKWKLYG